MKHHKLRFANWAPLCQGLRLPYNLIKMIKYVKEGTLGSLRAKQQLEN
jgi:hypothetical protein